MDGKRIQCLQNALHHNPIYLQSFLRYSEILLENLQLFIPLAFKIHFVVTPFEFREKVYFAENYRIMGLPGMHWQ